MAKRDARIDAYIERSNEFARPLLRHIRDVVHAACPDVEETMKWSAPTFMYQGSIMCGMASFKEHIRFHFWHGGKIRDAGGNVANDVIGKPSRLADLPSRKALTGFIKQAMALRAEGVKRDKPATPRKAAPAVPPLLAAALKKNRKAAVAFEKFPLSHKREYIEWINEAKREQTRERRVTQAIEWIADGKHRNWKYM